MQDSENDNIIPGILILFGIFFGIFRDLILTIYTLLVFFWSSLKYCKIGKKKHDKKGT